MTGNDLSAAGPVRTIGASVDDRPREREQIDRAREELDTPEGAYRRAMERGLAADSLTGIDAAFDQADRLQGRLLVSIRRLRVLEHESPADGSEPASARVSPDRARAEPTDRRGGAWRSDARSRRRLTNAVAARVLLPPQENRRVTVDQPQHDKHVSDGTLVPICARAVRHDAPAARHAQQILADRLERQYVSLGRELRVKRHGSRHQPGDREARRCTRGDPTWIRSSPGRVR